MIISELHAGLTHNSHDQPALKVNVTVDQCATGTASLPRGISTGGHEAAAFPCAPEAEGDAGFLSPEQTVGWIDHAIAPQLRGRAFDSQIALDRFLAEMDGTQDRSRLGAHVLLGISAAFARAAAVRREVPLHQWLRPQEDHLQIPVPVVNIFSGGAVGQNTLDLHSIAVVPLGAKSFAQAFEWVTAIHRAVPGLMPGPVSIAADGGYQTRGLRHEKLFEILLQATEASALRPGADVALYLDAAANHFRGRRLYHLKNELQILDAGRLCDLYKRWLTHYPVIGLEDGCGEDDWEGWKILTDELGDRVWLVGDDLVGTQPYRMRQVIKVGVANAVSLKPDQAGPLGATLESAAIAREAGHLRIIAARSVETDDPLIADLTPALDAAAARFGALHHPQHLAKYRRMIQIEKELGDRAAYVGAATFAHLPVPGNPRPTGI